jgi:hypothetical protein
MDYSGAVFNPFEVRHSMFSQISSALWRHRTRLWMPAGDLACSFLLMLAPVELVRHLRR